MQVKIEKLVYGGEGLAHYDGATAFVPYVLPGEVVEIAPLEQKKKFIRGELTRLIEPAPERIAADCPHFTVCGGCHYQHIPYEQQLSFKTEILRETLRRIGKIDWRGEIAVRSAEPWQYRNRAQWKIHPPESVGQSGIGYFRASSNVLCPVSHCPVLSPKLEAVLLGIAGALEAGKLPVKMREVEAFVDGADENVLLNVTLDSSPTRVKDFESILRSAAPGIESILAQDLSGKRMELLGPGFIHYDVGGESIRVGHLSFFQVNRFLVADLADEVAARAGVGDLAFDLYAGVGLFTLRLVRNFARVIGAEANPAAARDLKVNLAKTGSRARVANEDVESFLAHAKGKPDAIILDPPREGVERHALERIIALKPRKIVYVSCNPATLARDAAHLLTSYSIEYLCLFDMFPQTYHLESLMVFEQRK
ncbi:MAG: 23S rRNA (uracil(1939)-C(5))-methyltransferase RlmD [Candidatus Acidiferrales bacterium]